MLVILGVIAALTLPALVKRQVEAQNRTKIKKSMTMYDTAIQKMVIENGFRSENELSVWAKADNDTCSNAKGYFKVAESNAEKPCQFKTADGVWWDIGSSATVNVLNPIVAFQKDNLTTDKAAGDTNEAFYFVTTYDENTGAFRTNDATYEASINGADNEMDKLFAFTNNESLSSSSSGGGSSSGNENSQSGTSLPDISAYSTTCEIPCETTPGLCKSCTYKASYNNVYVYDEQGYETFIATNPSGTDKYETLEYLLLDENGYTKATLYYQDPGNPTSVPTDKSNLSNYTTCQENVYNGKSYSGTCSQYGFTNLVDSENPGGNVYCREGQTYSMGQCI